MENCDWHGERGEGVEKIVFYSEKKISRGVVILRDNIAGDGNVAGCDLIPGNSSLELSSAKYKHDQRSTDEQDPYHTIHHEAAYIAFCPIVIVYNISLVVQFRCSGRSRDCCHLTEACGLHRSFPPRSELFVVKSLICIQVRINESATHYEYDQKQHKEQCSEIHGMFLRRYGWE